MGNPNAAAAAQAVADALPPGLVKTATQAEPAPPDPSDQSEPFAAPAQAPLIWAALANAKRDIRAVAKDGKYEQGNTRYNFRGVDAVVNAVSPALARWGITLGFEVDNLERRPFKTKTGGDATATTARVTYRFIALDGSVHAVTVEAEANDSADKGTGKVMSVAYRIMLLQVFAIPTHDQDPDSERIEVGSPGFTPQVATWLRGMVNRTSLTGLNQLWGLVKAAEAEQHSSVPHGSGPTWDQAFLTRKRELEANQPAPAPAEPSGGND